MGYAFNPFTGNFDVTGAAASVPDPLTVNNLTVNTLLTAAHIHGNVAGSLYIHVKNTSNTTLAKGTPVYAVGAVGDTTTLEVAAADSADPAKSPAIGILDEQLIHNASGHAVMFGEIAGVNTGSYVIGDELYLASGGGLTSTRPASGYVQSLAVVGRVHASTGTILVWTASEVPSTDLAYNAATRQLSSSTGTDVTLPLAGADAGLMSAADKQQLANLAARLDAFRDAACFYVSKSGNNSNNGTSPGEPLATVAAAVSAANAYVTANPGARVKIQIGPGEFTETGLPFRLKPNILVQGALQRGTILKPATGQELLGFFALDSGCMVCDLRFAGHQATGTSSTDSTVGTRAWAVRLNEAANGGQGVILTASPYIKDCASITAEDDEGLAGSTSTGDTGGGVLVDGAACHPTSPLRSILCYGFTQQNLGGPGCVVRNDAYAELVSFFGLFGTWHVQCETGGQATLSGGGCSEFGIYGLVADGYSASPIFTGSLRVSASSGATTVDVVSLTANRLGSSSRPAPGLVMLLGGNPYVVQSSSPIDASGNVVADMAPTRAGYRVAFYNPSGVGLAGNVAQGAGADFRQRSQISAGCHSANYVGSGTNYSALPWNGGVPVRGNEAVERNLGRVFGLIVNDVGDVRIAGGAFSVDGTTGAVTINTSQFNLSGLNAIGPFSRNGGVSTVGVQLQEVSNSSALLASTGSADGNTAPTQFAVRTYTTNRFLTDVTVTAGLPLTISDTSTQDGQGYWTRTRNISLSLNAPNGLVRLDGSGLIPSALLPSFVDDVLEFANLAAFPVTGETGKIFVDLEFNRVYRWGGSAYFEVSPSPGSTDAVPEGTLNRYFTEARARGSISVASGSGLTYNSTTGQLGYSAPGTGAGSGSVTSVGLSLPGIFTVSGSPVTGSGTLTATLANQAARQVFAGPTSGSAPPAFRSLSGDDVGLGTSSTPQFAGLGLGVAPVAGWDLVIGDSLCQRRVSVTAVSGTYTLNVQAGNEFVTDAAINGATTINLSNLANIPTGYLWRGVLTFSYTSGTISWFTGNTGYTVKWDGGSAMTPTASEIEKVVIEVVGGATTIEIAPLKGRA